MIIKSQSQIKDNENGLYLVSTPIGNLKDITLRAIETLKKSTYILCEDTRVSRILLDRYEIKSRLISNHKFNESKNLNKIIELLKSGEIISLISDAGTPSISDPGAILVNECVRKNIKIINARDPEALIPDLLKFTKYQFEPIFIWFSEKKLYKVHLRKNEDILYSEHKIPSLSKNDLENYIMLFSNQEDLEKYSKEINEIEKENTLYNGEIITKTHKNSINGSKKTEISA